MALQRKSFELYVRGEIPLDLAGSLLTTTSRRHKDRSLFSRWHDSQADLIKLELIPGRPGRVVAHVLGADPGARGLSGFAPTSYDVAAYGRDSAYGYVTQPNHGLNYAQGKLWATNLVFGAPLELDLETWKPCRVLRYVEPDESAPRVSSTAHFAWSLNRRYAYFHQSLLCRESPGRPVQARDLHLIRLDTRTATERVWTIDPPPEDDLPEAANFHSAFYYEEEGKGFVGLLRTGAVFESLASHPVPTEHSVLPMPNSTIWIVPIDDERDRLRAELLPGIRELDGLALSHLDVDSSSGDGFVLYANFKESDVAEETHGVNIYGEDPQEVAEHYSGMIVEGLNCGQVIRYEKRGKIRDLKVFRREYDCSRTSLGHTWLPINIELDASGEHLFCTFAGFHPRLLPRHISSAYPQRSIDPRKIRYVPPLLMRFDAKTLQPGYDRNRGYLSYAEPVAFCVVGVVGKGWVCTFSPEVGLRIYRSDDLSMMTAHAVSAELMHWEDTHFHPDPAHMIFVPH